MSINDAQLDRLAQAIYEQLTYQNCGDWHWSRRTPAEKQKWLRAAKAAADAAMSKPTSRNEVVWQAIQKGEDYVIFTDEEEA